MRISDWSSDVCSSDLVDLDRDRQDILGLVDHWVQLWKFPKPIIAQVQGVCLSGGGELLAIRSEEHTSELQSLMRISYAVFCLKKKKPTSNKHQTSRYCTIINEYT